LGDDNASSAGQNPTERRRGKKKRLDQYHLEWGGEKRGKPCCLKLRNRTGFSGFKKRGGGRRKGGAGPRESREKNKKKKKKGERSSSLACVHSAATGTEKTRDCRGRKKKLTLLT